MKFSVLALVASVQACQRNHDCQYDLPNRVCATLSATTKEGEYLESKECTSRFDCQKTEHYPACDPWYILCIFDDVDVFTDCNSRQLVQEDVSQTTAPTGGSCTIDESKNVYGPNQCYYSSSCQGDRYCLRAGAAVAGWCHGESHCPSAPKIFIQ